MSDYQLPELPSDEELGIDDVPDDPPGPGGPAAVGTEPAGKTPPPTADRGPAWRGPVTLALLLATAWASSPDRSIPHPAPANAPDTAFSSARAMSTVSEIARIPRPPGSPEHARVRDHLLNRLQELGFETEVQRRTRVSTREEEAVAVTVQNIVARMAGTESTGGLLLAAHYDSRALTPGAGDDATGIGTILEILGSLQSELPLRNDLVVLFSDGEELGLQGARVFAEHHRWMADLSVVLNVEMRGSGGPSLMFQTGEENGWVVDQMALADPSPVANSIFVDIYRTLPNDTDFTVFLNAGLQGLNFAAIGRSENYHQPTDTPANLQEGTVQHHGERIRALTRHFGSVPLETVDAPDRSFVRLPFLGLLVLPLGLAWPLTLAVVAGLFLATFLATLRGARSRGIVLGAVLSLVAMAASALGAWAMVRWTAPLHAEYGAISPAFHDEVPYRIAVAFLAFGVTVGLFEAARRWVRPLEATLGALLLPVLTLAGVTLTAQGGALNLQLTLGAVVLLILLLAVTGLHRRQGWVAWVLTLLFILPVLALLYPLIDLMSVALGMGAAPVLGALWALVLLFLVPALEWMDRPNRWWAPLTGFVVAAVGLSVGVLRADPAPERPAPSTLLYTLDRDRDGLPVWARWVTTPDPEGLEWARAGAGGTFVPDSAGLLDGFSIPDRPYLIREAPLAAVAPPRVVVLRDTIIGGQRRVRLGILSRVGAEALRITAPAGVSFQGVAGTAEAAVDLEALGPGVRTLVHWGATEPDLTVALAGAAGPWEMAIEESLYRPREVFPADPFRRPPELMADITTGSDRVVIRTPYRVGDRSLAGSWAGPGAIATQGRDTLGAPGTASPDSLGADTLGAVLLGGDSLVGDPLAADSSAVDTLPPDTVGGPATVSDSTGTDPLAADSLPPDSIAPDTLPDDTLPPDSILPDTLAADTVPPDSIARDTLPPEPLPPDSIAAGRAGSTRVRGTGGGVR